MPSPPVEVFLTTIASQPALRKRQEYILRILQVKKVPFTSYDLASSEDAKKLWKRKAPLAKQQLPGILVGGMFPGTFEDFEEAVEYDELERFLRLDESWDADELDTPSLDAKPIGVPGASSPAQMTSQKPSFASSHSPLKDKTKAASELDAGSLLGDNSLHGVSVTDDELADLVKELGLEGDEAGDLVKGLSSSKEPASEPQTAPSEKKQDAESSTAEKSPKESVGGTDDPNVVTASSQSDKEHSKKEDDVPEQQKVA
ncbi:uncharacterized protein FOMMEDRAFT_146155 [Fomitiporia mediterranea MF3/22]|uniref:uncharacterized protein n=1 Tax=Fomitiporia mediterranea (strain MF3/22) TaxID=694068 RepID=UPI000440846B|nr:uncharacterized protein FOMMEDRAFT_146155 [Fomitiporia mediterranea MF3/22]EJD04089.1 hypothetical protein FOMMEDRAFT_146155 [Fomitiporia mediterranea MF3/22]